jgi:nucleoside-triphosphatase THEP1
MATRPLQALSVGIVPASVTLLHGPVHSGKTSRLRRWCEGRADVGGLLQLEGPAGRFLRDIATGKTEPLEPVPSGEPALEVGRFRFRAKAFAWAEARLAAGAGDPALRIVAIDEIGPLELSGGGLRNAVADALERHDGDLILVVRTPLVPAVLEAFAIPHAAVVAAADWPQAEQTFSEAP